MIEPRMATMLGYLTTDVTIAPSGARGRAHGGWSIRRSTPLPSTASARPTTACSRWRPATPASRCRDEDDPAFLEAMIAVAGHLAREIVRGGEGATKLVTMRVTGAASHGDAWLAVRTLANSPLVKTAIHGGDPNWGRLIAAAGRSGAAFVLDRASVSIGDVPLFVRRRAVRRAEPAGRCRAQRRPDDHHGRSRHGRIA